MVDHKLHSLAMYIEQQKVEQEAEKCQKWSNAVYGRHWNKQIFLRAAGDWFTANNSSKWVQIDEPNWIE